jgi:hypothetical protein
VAVAVVLAVAGLALGVSALVLPLAVPGYAGSYAHRAPSTLYDKAVAADLPHCAGAYSLSQCPLFLVSFAGYDNFTIPITDRGLGVVNVSFQLNHSCDSCELEIFQGNFSTQPILSVYPGSLFLLLNGTGSTVTLLSEGVERIVVVNYSQGSYWGPVTAQLKILYLGPLRYG